MEYLCLYILYFAYSTIETKLTWLLFLNSNMRDRRRNLLVTITFNLNILIMDYVPKEITQV